MSPFEDFDLVSAPMSSRSPYGDYEKDASGSRKSTELMLAASIRKHHPDLTVTVTLTGAVNLLGFAGAGHAQALLDPRGNDFFLVRSYIPPARRLDGGLGALADQIKFAKYHYSYRGRDFILYVADSFKDGVFGNPLYNYILHKPDASAGETVHSKSAATDALVMAAGAWTIELHEEIWVFDQGFWQKNAELWKSVQTASWDDVILDEDMKKGLVDDIEGFYDERDSYKKFAIPWKVRIPSRGYAHLIRTLNTHSAASSSSDRQEMERPSL